MINEKKEEIFRSICSLVQEGGFENVSISKIAQRIGKSKNLIFHYFPNKQTMILEFVKDYIEDIDISYVRNLKHILDQSDGRKAVEDYISALFEFHCNDRFDVKVYFSILGLCIIDEQISQYLKSVEEKTMEDLENVLTLLRRKNQLAVDDIHGTALELFFALNGIAVLQDTNTIHHQHFEQVAKIYKSKFIDVLLR